MDGDSECRALTLVGGCGRRPSWCAVVDVHGCHHRPKGWPAASATPPQIRAAVTARM